MYDGIKFARAQPVHKVKADRDERSGEPAGNVHLKGCPVCVEAMRAAVGADRTIATQFALLLSVDTKRKTGTKRGGRVEAKGKAKSDRKRKIIYLAF